MYSPYPQLAAYLQHIHAGQKRIICRGCMEQCCREFVFSHTSVKGGFENVCLENATTSLLIHPYCTHGDHPSLLYTWGPSIPIVHRGTIHPYCTHGDHPSLLYTWGPSIPIVHMGTIHPYCTHGDHPTLLYTWGPSIPRDHPSLLYTWGPSISIVHMGTIHSNIMGGG